jgi:hypothetical protein
MLIAYLTAIKFKYNKPSDVILHVETTLVESRETGQRVIWPLYVISCRAGKLTKFAVLVCELFVPNNTRCRRMMKKLCC